MKDDYDLFMAAAEGRPPGQVDPFEMLSDWIAHSGVHRLEQLKILCAAILLATRMHYPDRDMSRAMLQRCADALRQAGNHPKWLESEPYRG